MGGVRLGPHHGRSFIHDQKIVDATFALQLTKSIGDFQTFISSILDNMKAQGFVMTDFVQLDHICYRTTSIQNYEVKKTELSSLAQLLGETMVNNRPISTFRLNQPINHLGWRIDAVELPAPKTGSIFSEGLEHVEFVLFDDPKTFLQKYQGKPFIMKAAERGINPEIGLKLNQYSVKFHLLNLPTVVYLEQKLGITEVKDGDKLTRG